MLPTESGSRKRSLLPTVTLVCEVHEIDASICNQIRFRREIARANEWRHFEKSP